MMMMVVMVIRRRKETMIAAGSAMMVDGWSLPCSPHYNHCIFAPKHSAALAEKFPSKVVSLASNFYLETSSVSCRYQISNHLHCNSISRSSSSHISRQVGIEIILPWKDMCCDMSVFEMFLPIIQYQNEYELQPTRVKPLFFILYWLRGRT